MEDDAPSGIYQATDSELAQPEPTEAELTEKYGDEYPAASFSRGSHVPRYGLLHLCHADDTTPSDGVPRFRLCHEDYKKWITEKFDDKSGKFKSPDGGIEGTYVFRPKGELYAQWYHTDGSGRGDSSTWPDGAAKGSRVTLCGEDGRHESGDSHQKTTHWRRPPFGYPETTHLPIAPQK